jgi:hypothetical protein
MGTAIWYLNNNILINALYGPTLPAGWAVVAAADFDGDGLSMSSTMPALGEQLPGISTTTFLSTLLTRQRYRMLGA